MEIANGLVVVKRDAYDVQQFLVVCVVCELALHDMCSIVYAVQEFSSRSFLRKVRGMRGKRGFCGGDLMLWGLFWYCVRGSSLAVICGTGDFDDCEKLGRYDM